MGRLEIENLYDRYKHLSEKEGAILGDNHSPFQKRTPTKSYERKSHSPETQVRNHDTNLNTYSRILTHNQRSKSPSPNRYSNKKAPAYEKETSISNETEEPVSAYDKYGQNEFDNDSKQFRNLQPKPDVSASESKNHPHNQIEENQNCFNADANSNGIPKHTPRIHSRNAGVQTKGPKCFEASIQTADKKLSDNTTQTKEQQFFPVDQFGDDAIIYRQHNSATNQLESGLSIEEFYDDENVLQNESTEKSIDFDQESFNPTPRNSLQLTRQIDETSTSKKNQKPSTRKFGNESLDLSAQQGNSGDFLTHPKANASTPYMPESHNYDFESDQKDDIEILIQDYDNNCNLEARDYNSHNIQEQYPETPNYHDQREDSFYFDGSYREQRSERGLTRGEGEDYSQYGGSFGTEEGWLLPQSGNVEGVNSELDSFDYVAIQFEMDKQVRYELKLSFIYD